MNVQVLGTKVNVNACDDEANIKVTLLEGSVKVSDNQTSLTIKPNQQAIVKSNAPVSLNNNVDVEQVMAWKNGKFQFSDADISTVMREVARWYDVEVVYESKPTKLFRGGVTRDMSAANMFKVLEETGGVHFRIENRKVVVMK